MTSTHRPRLFALFALVLVAAGSARAADDPPEWRRRGDRSPSEAWDALEGQPAPSLAGLSDWRYVSPLDWADLAGNVVLVVHFESWQAKLEEELARLVALTVAHQADGLVVLAVHPPRNVRAHELFHQRHFVPLPFAVDTEGALATALAVKRHPTYHLVGRDGRVRIAGLNMRRDEDGVRYLDSAIAAVLEEPWEGERQVLHLDLPLDRIHELGREEEREAGGVVDAEEKRPLVLGEDGWPLRIEKKLNARVDLRGKPAPEFEAQTWLGDSPDVEGKCWLAYLFSTADGTSVPFLPKLQRMHARFGDDLVVAAISPQAPDVSERNRRPWASTLVDFFAEHPGLQFYRAYDGQARMQNAIGVHGLPHAILVDSGGTVRWQGYPFDPKDPLTKKLVAAVIERDAKRRAVEKAAVEKAAAEKAAEEKARKEKGTGGDGGR